MTAIQRIRSGGPCVSPDMGLLARTSIISAALLALVAVGSPAGAGAATLVAEVGPGYTINLRTQAGVKVRSVRAGTTHTIVVRDRSDHHNFRLSGPGFTRQTTVPFVGTQTWTVRFVAGTWTYLCQPHSLSMKASFPSR